MSRISPFNHEGYYDPTAYAALNSAERAHQKKQKTIRTAPKGHADGCILCRFTPSSAG